MDLLFSNEAHGCIVIHIFAVAQQNRARVVILHKASLHAFHLQHSEGGVGKLALPAHGQRRGDGFNTFIHRELAGHQGGKDGGSQRGKNVGFHAAAQPVGKNNGQLTAVLCDVIGIAAERFIMLIDACMPAFDEKVFHGIIAPRFPS